MTTVTDSVDSVDSGRSSGHSSKKKKVEFRMLHWTTEHLATSGMLKSLGASRFKEMMVGYATNVASPCLFYGRSVGL